MTLHRSELARLREGYDPVARRSASLPAWCYSGEKYREVERQAIFHRSWQYVCHVEKLRQPGQYVAFEVQGRGVIALRDRDGKLRAFYNVCRHRAHELLKGEGQVRLITCPYHAWSYDLEGGLVAARRSEHVENFDKRDFCLTPVQIEEFCTLVFVNLDPDAKPLAEQAGTLGEEIRSYAPDLDKLTHARRLTYNVNCNWKVLIDNFLECYHCPVAHKDFVSLVDMDSYKVTTQGIYSSHMAQAGLAGNTAYDVADAPVTDHAVWWLWPNSCLLRYPGEGNLMVLHVIPTGPDTAYETYDIFFLNDTPNQAQEEAIAYLDKVLQREDIDLCESVQRGMRAPGYERGRFMVDPEGGGLSEHGVHHFHGLVLEAYAAIASD